MVKFGRHLQFYLECEQPEGEHYIVPYSEIRDIIGDNDSEQFVDEWRECLRLSAEDFTSSTATLWRKLFAALHNHPEARGARIEDALNLYVSVEDVDAGQDLLASARNIYSAADVNAEALRKLIKKFDKHALERGDNLLSPSLLPELYTSSFSSSLKSLECNIDTLRRLTSEVAGDSSGWEADSETNSERSKQDEESVKKRADEFQWLNDTVSSICPSNLPHVVAHRGFHNPHGLVDVRPVENSLQAYEAAWSSGIHLCECDVALTKDEKLVLAHDEDFSRLALIPGLSTSKTKVKDLTLRQIMSMQLRSGIRPPLLVDVLHSAMNIGPHAKLIIEIKPGNSEAGSALARMFTQYPELMQNVAVIMSFDAFIVHSLRRDLVERFGPSSTPPNDPSTSEMAYSLRGYGVHSMVGSRKEPTRTSLSTMNDAAATFDHASANDSGVRLPKVMLVTVAEPPQQQCELWADVDDLSQVEEWLKHEDDALDGVYLQFQPKMLQPEGAALLKEFSQKYAVGVWGLLGRDPDDYPTLQTLVRNCGVSYYNTDLPRNFLLKKTKRQPTPPLLEDEDDDEFFTERNLPARSI